MSGMVGMVRLDNAPVDPRLLAQMTAHMAFRGPEGQRLWCDRNVGLGNTQLTTVDDVDTLPQPYSLEGQVWITADARVDGRAELMAKLRHQGRDVGTRTADVALILHAYHAWGTACLQHLIGDFAFSLWDAPRRRLLCARDLFGVAPFFYAQVGECLIVSNTLNCIRLHPDISAELNEQTIADLLLFLHNRRFDTTIWRDVRCLPPAHMLLAEEGKVQIRRYWQPADEVAYQRYQQPESYVEHFRDLFRQAVSDRLRSRRVVAELTGGMDTSSIVATASRLMGNGNKAVDLRAHTIAFRYLLEEKEGDYAALIAHALQVPQEIFYFEDYERDSPVTDPAFVPPEPAPSMMTNTSTLAHYRCAAEHAPVLLSGIGGDPALAADAYHWRRLFANGGMSGLWADIINQWRVFGLQRPSGLGIRRRLLRWQGRRNSRLLPFPHWFQPDLVARLDLRQRKARFDEIDESRSLRRGMVEYSYWSSMMRFQDPAYTALPLRCFYPFFDVRLFDYLSSLPPLPWLQHKALLRLSMRDSLPDAIVTRPKTPLTRDTNVEHTLALGRRATWQLDLSDEPALARYIVPARLRELIQAPEKADHGGYRQANAAVYLAYWLRHRHSIVDPRSLQIESVSSFG